MSAFAWIIVLLFTAILVWSLIEVVVHRFLTVDETTLSVFKLMLRHRGLDPSAFPDAALIDIIAAKHDQAQRNASAPMIKSAKSEIWCRDLFRLLGEEADGLERVMSEGYEKHANTCSAAVLLKYGIIEPRYPPALSVEQYLEAAARGTLYEELDERISKRE